MTENKLLDNAIVPKKPQSIGRPTTCNAEVADKITSLISIGGSLKHICGRDGIPAYGTVIHWLYDVLPENCSDARIAFRKNYESAVTARAWGMADELISIADNDSTDVARDRLRFQARQWVMSKLLPAYQERQELTVQGGDRPLRTINDTTDEELARRVALMLTLADPKNQD